MQSIGQQLVSTGIKRLNPTDSSINWYDNDHLFDQLSDLVNSNFKAWYCKVFYKLGKDKVLLLASQAKADATTSPQRLFSYLLKKEMAK